MTNLTRITKPETYRLSCFFAKLNYVVLIEIQLYIE